MKRTIQTAYLALCLMLTAFPAFAQQKTGELQIFRRVRFFETTCSGATAGQSVICADSTLHSLRLSNNNAAFGDVLTSVGSITERGRTVPMGEANTRTFAAGNYTSDVGTWVVASGNVTTERWYLVGKRMFFDFYIDATTTTGAPTQLRIAIPGSFTSAAAGRSVAAYLFVSGVAYVGTVTSTAGGSFIIISKLDDSSFGAVAGGVYARGQIAFEVQ